MEEELNLTPQEPVAMAEDASLLDPAEPAIELADDDAARSVVDPRSVQAAYVLAQPGDDESEIARQVGNESLARRADEILAGQGDPFEILPMAQRLDQADPFDVQDGVMERLEEPQERGFRLDVRSARARADNNVKQVDEFLRQFNQRNSRSGAGGMAVQVGEVVGSFLLPIHYTQLATIINEFDPSFTFTDISNIGGSMQEFRERVKQMPEAQLRTMLPKLGRFIENLSARGEDDLTNATGNRYMARDLARQLLGGLGAGDTRGALDTTLSYLEVGFGAVGLAAVAKVGGRAIRRIVNGNEAGSAADAVARTNRGATLLQDSVRTGNDSALAALGTDAARVTEDLTVPKPAVSPAATAPSSKPYIDEYLVTPAEINAARERAIADVSVGLSNRMNNAVIEATDEGLVATLRLGPAQRGKPTRGFKTEAGASRYAASMDMDPSDFRIVKSDEGNEWFVEVQRRVDTNVTTADAQAIQGVRGTGRAGSFFANILGKNTYFNSHIVNTGNWASRQSAAAAVEMRRVLQPYSNLLAPEATRVNNLLAENNGRKYLTRDEMASLGLSERQMAAMEAVYEAGRRNLAEINSLAVARARANGFREYRIGNNKFMATAIDQRGWFPGRDITDMATGNKITAESIRTTLGEYQLYRIMGERGTPRFGVVKRGTQVNSKELGPFLVHSIPGYIPRKYEAPFFIRRVNTKDDAIVETEAIMTAQSLKDAEAALVRLSNEGAEGEYKIFRASETMDSPSTFDELDALREAGLLKTSSRREDILPDARLDDPALRGVQESIEAMVVSTSRAAGISRWSDMAIARWEKTFPELGKFNVAKVPPRPAVDDAGRYEEAMALRQHILMVNGMHKSTLSELSRGFRQRISDILYNSGTRTLGDEVSGLASPLTDAGKKFAAAMFLFLNPVRQAMMQMTMIPTYTGVAGGLKYAATGAFGRDAMVLMLARDGVDANKIAQMVGSGSRAEVQEMIDAYRKFGPAPLVQDHIFTAGIAADSGFGLTSLAGQLAGRATQFSKRVGFDFGTLQDKNAQWLFSLNRFKELNGRLPKADNEWKDVLGFGENLGLNMNSSDSLLTQQGVIGLMTQFASHQIKMTGRVLGLEGQFTRAEKLRMATATLLMYGTAGYGANEVVDRLLTEADVQLEPKQRQAVSEGIAGFVLDRMFGMWDTEGDSTELAFAQNFSPASGFTMGVTPNLLARIVTGSASLGHALEALPFSTDFAALGAGQAVVDAVKLGVAIAGQTNVPLTDAAMMASQDFFESFPVYSQFIRGMAAFNAGTAVDSKGNPIIDATRGEGVARMLFGIRDKDTVDFQNAMTEYYGMYSERDQNGMDTEIDDAARTTATLATRVIRSFNNGEVTRQGMIDFFEKHNNALVKNMHPNHQRRYLDQLWRELDNSGEMKSQVFAEKLYEEAFRGNPSDVRDLLRTFPIKNQEAMIQGVENLVNNEQLRGLQ